MQTYSSSTLILVLLCYKSSALFKIPDVTFEAYTPKGFRMSIPAVTGIELVGFHANVNKSIEQVETGDINNDIISATGDAWTYVNKGEKLTVGDEINYWIFVQHNKLGYRRDNQVWTVKELVPKEEENCLESLTIVPDRLKTCSESLILEELFSGNQVNTNTWTVQQYIPDMGPDYEFVSYQKQIPEIEDNKLVIRPIFLDDVNAVKGELNLRDGCTSIIDSECYKRYKLSYLPPVKSGRIVSKFKFTYGTIEIKAKLPAGDWIYPQIYLEQVSNVSRKIWIAYARGNEDLKLNNEEIGGRLLFGGPSSNPTEPTRSRYLKKLRSYNESFTEAARTFKVKWDPNGLTLFVGETQYGKIDKTEMMDLGFSSNQQFQLVIGVGVGGNNDFPNDCVSSGIAKPWKNRSRHQMKDFFNSKNSWIRTWTANSALEVTHVKIRAV